MLATGDRAPSFTATDQDGNTVELSDFAGRRLVLYFYPKDDTPGCTREAKGFAAHAERFADRDIAIVGVSTDDAGSHCDFRDEYGLEFPLLADTEGELVEAFDVRGRNGRAERVTYVIGPDGVIEAVYDDVDPEEHAQQLLDDL